MKKKLLGLLNLTLFFFLLQPTAHSNTELDRKYALNTIGYLREWDNMDGLFVDYVSQAYKEYFSHQSRFVVQDLSKADAILSNSKLPYQKVIDDPEILGQLARSTKSESIIRTKIRKEGAQYQVQIDWLHSPKMEILSSMSFNLQEPGTGKALGTAEIRDEFAKALDQMIAKIPFRANVTGRDNNTITVNIGANAGLKKGDTLVIGTLDEVKKHPLLNEIVDWRLSQTGKADVETADEAIAFAKISEEDPGRAIMRYQKVIQIIPAPVQQEIPVNTEKPEQVSTAEETPKLGWISGGLWSGGFSRQYTVTSSTTPAGDSGGGFFFGAIADGELWLNRDFFVDMGFAYGFSGYSQNNLATNSPTPATGVTADVFKFKLAVGYSYLVSGDFFGPKGWIKLGFRSTSYNLPATASENTSPTGFNGLVLGIGGDLPIRSGFGATLDMDFGILTSGSDSSNLYGDLSGSSAFNFYVGGYYRYTSRIRFQLGFDITANSGTYSSVPSSLSQKVITVVPAIVYYF